MNLNQKGIRKMKKLLPALGAVLALTGCLNCGSNDDSAIEVVSPDGRNAIRLTLDPLSYEVLRDGVRLVSPSPIGLRIDGRCLCADAALRTPVVSRRRLSGSEKAPIYKKDRLSLAGNETFANFGDWGLRLIARDDGVAYRFETDRAGQITVEAEKATVRLACEEARAVLHETPEYGCEETPPQLGPARAMVSAKNSRYYLPALFNVRGKTVLVTDADVFDYPVWNLVRTVETEGNAAFDADFAPYPESIYRSGADGWDRSKACERRARWEIVRTPAPYLVKTDGRRTFPWRAFMLADEPMKLAESDLVRALARPCAEDSDFSWVKPGKVTWEWWNAWDNIGDPLYGKADGCTTETYRRFFDLAAEYGVEYVIFDEGWSQKLDIWHLNPKLDLKGLIDYGNAKGVGTILWMAWGQIVGEEERVAREFAKMGVKGFKVDFMDRGDAQCERFYWDFAKACAKYRLVIDYHGAHRPTGLSRAYPNVLNFEGIHGLECMKWFDAKEDFMRNDVAAAFTRMSAGPMDYTPGAMDNYPIGKYPTKEEKDIFTNPGSLGTRCRQMAMMALYEAPLQMLCDSVRNYRANDECFRFMAATPVVWAETRALGGSPDTFAALARKAKDGSWYVAAISDATAREFTLDTAFLGGGRWKAEIFRDADDADVAPTHYRHETRTVKRGEKLVFRMAKGGGFVVKFTKM